MDGCKCGPTEALVSHSSSLLYILTLTSTQFTYVIMSSLYVYNRQRPRRRETQRNISMKCVGWFLQLLLMSGSVHPSWGKKDFFLHVFCGSQLTPPFHALLNLLCI